jgi:hypothetical protein
VLVADDPALADALLLLSYPLHPPRRPTQLRTQHFAALRTPTLFVHGTRDPFGSIAELNRARRAIAGRSALVTVEGAGHDLMRGGADVTLPTIVRAFGELRRG